MRFDMSDSKVLDLEDWMDGQMVMQEMEEMEEGEEEGECCMYVAVVAKGRSLDRLDNMHSHSSWFFARLSMYLMCWCLQRSVNRSMTG